MSDTAITAGALPAPKAEAGERLGLLPRAGRRRSPP